MSKSVSKKILKDSLFSGSNRPRTAQTSPSQRQPRARGAYPRTRPQPGPGPAKQRPAWAARSPTSPKPPAAVGSHRTDVRPLRPNKTPPRSLAPSNPRSSRSLLAGLSRFLRDLSGLLLATTTEGVTPPRASSPASVLAWT
jgi:hypothetical protein